MRVTGKSAFLGVACCFLCTSFAAAKGSGFEVVHNFAGGSTDGASPFAAVTPVGHGKFVVPTDGGGSAGRGTVTLIKKDGTSQVLHSFTGGSDGQNADGTLVSYKGALFGTTTYGGTPGLGTIYRLDPDGGQYSQIHAFQGRPSDGAFPYAGLAVGPDHYLYGTTLNAGNTGLDDGTLFKINPATNVETIIYSFDARGIGSHPYAGVALDSTGGTYVAASSDYLFNSGGLYFDYANGYTIQFLFGPPPNYSVPIGTLLYTNGEIYGTTRNGGANNLGMIFKIDAYDYGGIGMLHTFQGIYGNSDGSFPEGALAFNKADGQLYGTTLNGGSASDLGTVFKVDPNTGVESVVHAFTGADGSHPIAGLYIKKNVLYGTTSQGGAYGGGVMFKINLKKVSGAE